MTTLARLILAAGVLLAGGCMQRQPMQSEQMDKLWQLSPPVWSQAESEPIKLAEGRAYSRIEIDYEPSPVWCIIALHELAVAPPEGQTLRIPLSMVHARATADLMERLGRRTRDMVDAAAASEQNPRRWATATAQLLWQIHLLAAGVSQSSEARRHVTVDDTAAWVVLPLLEVIAGRQAGGPSLRGIWSEDLQVAEMRLSRVVLLISLRLTGKPASDELVETILKTQCEWLPETAVARMRDVLLDYYRKTPRTFEPLPQTAADASLYAGHFIDGMNYIKRLIRQWPKVNRLAFEMHRFEGKPVMVLEFDIRPGEQVVFSGLDFFAPDIIFNGQGRVEIRPELPNGNGKIIRFYAVGGQGVQLRFSSLPFVLTRLLAFPLKDGVLREVRYSSPVGCHGHVLEVLMETVGQEEEPRRLLRIEKCRSPLLQDRPGLPPRLIGRSSTSTFTYYDGRHRWHLIHTSIRKPELWRKP